jgi:hypothetical protein
MREYIFDELERMALCSDHRGLPNSIRAGVQLKQTGKEAGMDIHSISTGVFK